MTQSRFPPIDAGTCCRALQHWWPSASRPQVPHTLPAWAAVQVIRRIDVPPRDIKWSDNGELVALIGEASFYVLRFDRGAVEVRRPCAGAEHGVVRLRRSAQGKWSSTEASPAGEGGAMSACTAEVLRSAGAGCQGEGAGRRCRRLEVPTFPQAALEAGGGEIDDEDGIDEAFSMETETSEAVRTGAGWLHTPACRLLSAVTGCLTCLLLDGAWNLCPQTCSLVNPAWAAIWYPLAATK